MVESFVPSIPSTPERRLLHSERLWIDKKEFLFDLYENHLGRCLKITEYYKDHRNFIVVPISGLQEFRDVATQFSAYPIST